MFCMHHIEIFLSAELTALQIQRSESKEMSQCATLLNHLQFRTFAANVQNRHRNLLRTFFLSYGIF